MPPADNRAHLAAAAARRSSEARQRATDALRRLDATGTPITFAVVADNAGLSRSWLYRDPDIRAEIQRLRTATLQATRPPAPAAERATDASLHQRLSTLLGDNRALRDENRQLRDQIARLLGTERAEHPTNHASVRPIGPAAEVPPVLSTTCRQRKPAGHSPTRSPGSRERPPPRPPGEALAARRDGAALDRRRDGRRRSPVPPRQGLQAAPAATRRPRRSDRRPARREQPRPACRRLTLRCPNTRRSPTQVQRQPGHPREAYLTL